MRTVKLVIVGDSGVGKTTLRTQFVSGRFSTGYRATIGTDFITKTLPHPSNSDESITLQIWDTAGQERFASLASAFFRGADAVMLTFDVTKPQTLQNVRKWWNEFRERAPVPEGEEDLFCVVAVGNKIDLSVAGESVSEENARVFMRELIPSSEPATPEEAVTPQESTDDRHLQLPSSSPSPPPPLVQTPSSTSIDIKVHRTKPSVSSGFSRSRSRSRQRLSGTMTSTRTTLTVYHTPQSSFDESDFHSAMSRSPTSSSTRSPTSSSFTRRPLSSSSIASSPTITQSLYAAQRQSDVKNEDIPLGIEERGPVVFFTSAKTGERVQDLFSYVARRVVLRREREEREEARILHYREGSDATAIQLEAHSTKDRWKVTRCCS